MTILISHPETVSNETQIINEILDLHCDVIFHLRKPDWNLLQTEKLLKAVNTDFHQRIVIHQHFELAERFDLKGIHLKEADRKNQTQYSAPVISTSFHSPDDALDEGGRFEYFFCSPVFESISKSGYIPAENWDISGESELFRTKAVALGGIDASKKQIITEKGFENIAVLGAVWNSDYPVKAFTEIVRAFAR